MCCENLDADWKPLRCAGCITWHNCAEHRINQFYGVLYGDSFKKTCLKKPFEDLHNPRLYITSYSTLLNDISSVG